MPPIGGIRTSLTQRVDAALAGEQTYAIDGSDMTQFRDTFQPGTGVFSPGYPVAPAMPGQVRAYDYPVSQNINYKPRSYDPISFEQLRALADNHDITRLAIETRKDQLEKLNWSIKSRDQKKGAGKESGGDKNIEKMTAFWSRPDGVHPFATWLRLLCEDMLVLDAPTLEVRTTRGGEVIGLDVVDGASIKVLIDDTGRRPFPPAPAYMQVIHGVPWRLLTSNELIYLPRNPRSNKLYGFSPVEQIIMTVNIGLRRQITQLQHFTDGNVPRGLINAPEGWSPEQVISYQEWFDGKLEGNTAERAKVLWGPANSKYQAFKDPPFKDEFDEWLARVVCYAFSLPPSAFVRQINRATAESAQEAALEEGLAPLMGWVKRLADYIIQERFGLRDLEFGWGEIRPVDAEVQSRILDSYVSKAVYTIDEVRHELGKEPHPDGLGNIPLIIGAGGAQRLEDAIKEPEPVVPLGPDGLPMAGPKVPGQSTNSSPVGGKNGGKPAAPGATTPAKEPGPKDSNSPSNRGAKRDVAKSIATLLRSNAAGPLLDELLEKADRLSKEGAGYLAEAPVGSGDTCSNCSMFTDGRCTLVEGPISPEGTCDYFEALDKTITTETGLVADDRARRMRKVTCDDVAGAAAACAEPTAQQKANGNYKKGHIKIHGLDITIENPKGSTRTGHGWSVEMPAHYGYFKRTLGQDGDQVDVYIGPNPESEAVFIIDQLTLGGATDEHKVMLGYNVVEEALSDYRLAFSDGVDRVGAVHRVSLAGLKAWLKGDTTTPIGALVGKAAHSDWPEY